MSPKDEKGGSWTTAVRAHIARFFYGSPEDCKPLKITLGFPVGLAIAYVLYILLIEPLKISESMRLTIGGILGFGLALSFALSVQVRCMVSLLIPMFFSKEGRAYVGTFAIALLISGPITNIMANGKEVTRSLSCTVELLANNSKVETEFNMKPLQNFAEQLGLGGDMFMETMAAIDEAFYPIRKEMTDPSEEDSIRGRTDAVDNEFNEPSRSHQIDRRYEGVEDKPEPVKKEKNYMKKVDFRCEDVFTIGVQNCVGEFKAAEVRCKDYIPIIGVILCLPLKLTIICDLIYLLKSALSINCDSVDIVDPGVGEAYVTSDSSVGEFNKAFNVDMKFKYEKNAAERIHVMTAKEVAVNIESEFDTRQVFVTQVLNLMQLALGFAFLLLFKQAYNYTKSYISNINFDNSYITTYFKKIDARRFHSGKSILLPLKKFERKKAIEAWTPLLRSVEKSKLVKGSIRLLVNIFFVSLIILVDHLLYAVLDMIQRNSRIDYKQTGVHEVKVEVLGTGFIANIVRNILSGFNTHHDIDEMSTNYECLPKPIPLKSSLVYSMYGIYVIIWILILFEAYGLRLRRVICSFFFRKREKIRVLYLYNNMTKQRRGFLTHAKRIIKKKAKAAELQKKVGLFFTLKKKMPRLCGCLKYFKSGKNTCLICEDLEDPEFHNCETDGCDFGYCKGCWEDVDKRCYACAPPEELDLSTDASSDTSVESD